MKKGTNLRFELIEAYGYWESAVEAGLFVDEAITLEWKLAKFRWRGEGSMHEQLVKSLEAGVTNTNSEWAVRWKHFLKIIKRKNEDE